MAARFSLSAPLSHRLELQSRHEAVGEGGELVTTWSPVARVWGALVDSRVVRSEEAQQNQETAQHRVLIRHRNDVASGWRFLLDGRELAILTVIDPDQSRRFLSCLCEEVAR